MSSHMAQVSFWTSSPVPGLPELFIKERRNPLIQISFIFLVGFATGYTVLSTQMVCWGIKYFLNSTPSFNEKLKLYMGTFLYLF